MKPSPSPQKTLLSSVRVRLTLWNVGVMALVLVTLGLLLHHRVEANLTRVVDEDLSRRADFFKEGMERLIRHRAEEAAPKKPGQPPQSGGRDANRPPRWIRNGDTDDPRRPRILTPDSQNFFVKEPLAPLDPSAFRQALQQGGIHFTTAPPPATTIQKPLPRQRPRSFVFTRFRFATPALPKVRFRRCCR